MARRQQDPPVTVTIINPPSQAQLDRFWEGVRRICFRQAVAELLQEAEEAALATKTSPVPAAHPELPD